MDRSSSPTSDSHRERFCILIENPLSLGLPSKHNINPARIATPSPYRGQNLHLRKRYIYNLSFSYGFATISIAFSNTLSTLNYISAKQESKETFKFCFSPKENLI